MRNTQIIVKSESESFSFSAGCFTTASNPQSNRVRNFGRFERDYIVTGSELSLKLASRIKHGLGKKAKFFRFFRKHRKKNTGR